MKKKEKKRKKEKKKRKNILKNMKVEKKEKWEKTKKEKTKRIIFALTNSLCARAAARLRTSMLLGVRCDRHSIFHEQHTSKNNVNCSSS